MCYIELPWTDATVENEEFLRWRQDDYLTETPWSKLGNTALSLARQILNEAPAKRLTLSQILKHPWMKFEFDSGKFNLIIVFFFNFKKLFACISNDAALVL